MPRNSPRPGTPPGIRSNCALAPLPAPIAPVPIDGRRKPRYHILITLGQRDKPPLDGLSDHPITGAPVTLPTIKIVRQTIHVSTIQLPVKFPRVPYRNRSERDEVFNLFAEDL